MKFYQWYDIFVRMANKVSYFRFSTASALLMLPITGPSLLLHRLRLNEYGIIVPRFPFLFRLQLNRCIRNRWRRNSVVNRHRIIFLVVIFVLRPFGSQFRIGLVRFSPCLSSTWRSNTVLLFFRPLKFDSEVCNQFCLKVFVKYNIIENFFEFFY